MVNTNLDGQELTDLKKLQKLAAAKMSRDSHGHFIKNTEDKPIPPKTPLFSINQNVNTQSASPSSKSSVPPLLDIKITNPVTYLKAWWKKIMANEGIDFKLKIHPLTALALGLMISAVFFGLGRFSLPADNPIIKYIPQLAPENPWRDTAFTGVLRYTEANKKYYLITSASEAITLGVPTNVNMTKLIGKRIMAVGKYNTQTGILVVTDVSDLEILPAQIVPIPLIPADQISR